MIAFVSGLVAAVTPSSVIVEAGGLGYELICTPGTIAQMRLGERVTLPTAMVVREDSMTLFGFASDDEKQIFELVQIASGVGPKLAQAITGVLTPDQLRQAIADDDVKTITQVPGIGQRSAQRIILELKDRIGAPVGARSTATRAGWQDQVREGLVGLGYKPADADKAVDAVAEQAGADPNVGVLLRAALQTLAKG